MTEREKIERELILDILAESSKWRITEEDQNDDCIRLEVMDRARRLLLGVETVDANGYAQSHPDNPKTVTKPGEFVDTVEEPLNEDDFKALEAARLNEHLASPEKVWKAKERWKADKVRCQENGKVVWRKKCECVQQPRDNSHGGPAWMWKWMGPATDEKKAQEEQMWEEHERS